MDIPKSVREHFAARARARRHDELAAQVRPRCRLGPLAQLHEHNPDGSCVLKNWSNDEVHTSPLGAVWKKEIR